MSASHEKKSQRQLAEDRIEHSKAEITRLRKEIEAREGERNRLIPAAASGSVEARAKLAAMASDDVKASEDVHLHSAAIVLAENDRSAAIDREVAVEKARRDKERRKLESEITDNAGGIDDDARRLTERLKRHRLLIAKHQDAKNLLMKEGHMLRMALLHAGIREFVEFPNEGHAHKAPLKETLDRRFGRGQAEDRPKPPQARVFLDRSAVPEQVRRDRAAVKTAPEEADGAVRG